LYDYAGSYVANKMVFRTKIVTFCCPSDNADREDKYGVAVVNDGGPGFTRSNVVACFRPDGNWIEPGAPSGGVSGAPTRRALFNFNVARTIAQVVDGTSNTVAFSEIISGPNDTGDTRGLWWQDYGCHYEHLHNPNVASDTILGASWASAMCDPSKVYCTGLGNWADAHFSASSYHPGGVNTALADGSVRFANDTVNLAVWQALGSIDGGGKNDSETNPSAGF
jgi:prepilin-type processing-associated H-X9-DG protein